ncbi:unnamed protein product [Rhizoctonia solani]|uniref:Uncharacterized protein n=1 Tax=Rhizoctonia solani TaxID=456999 RepID=A0A8H2WID7_9AGAM|nr:unnamed protein product [Rhizoctonia solani]
MPNHVQYTTGTSSNAVPGVASELAQSSNADFGIEEDDLDPEGIYTILCTAPIVDNNLKENTLGFVLQSYSRWAIVAIFEPLKIARTVKERIIRQFSSEDTRMRCILRANVMDMFGRQLLVDETRSLIVARLISEVRENSSAFLVQSSYGGFASELARDDAMRVLDSTLELMTLQIYTQPMAACIQLLEDAAPVFRRACSEPLGQPLDLLGTLLETDLNIRHYATIDIMTSALTGRATLFKYRLPFSFELSERVFRAQEDCGLYWLHGLPDQFIIMIAWINSLCETPEYRTNSELITQIEETLQQIRININQPSDSALRIGRTVVQECWRYAMLVYLYMVLCGANANDPRVVRAQKGFMRLAKGIKPGRNPDAFLVSPMIIVGVATSKERDRGILRQRVLNLREYATPSTAGNDSWIQVEDVWARSKAEGRAAVWSDLRIACFRVSDDLHKLVSHTPSI